MPTKAKTCCGTSSDFSRFMIQPSSLQRRRAGSLRSAQRSLDMVLPCQSSRNWCKAVFWMWMREANCLATKVKSQGAELRLKGRALPVTEILLRQPRSYRFHLDPGRLQLQATGSLGRAGFSRDTAERIAAAQAIYDGKWHICCACCGEREADPFAACIPLMAEFLTYFFRG